MFSRSLSLPLSLTASLGGSTFLWIPPSFLLLVRNVESRGLAFSLVSSLRRLGRKGEKWLEGKVGGVRSQKTFKEERRDLLSSFLLPLEVCAEIHGVRVSLHLTDPLLFKSPPSMPLSVVPHAGRLSPHSHSTKGLQASHRIISTLSSN